MGSARQSHLGTPSTGLCRERALGWDPTVRPPTDCVTLFLAQPSARQASGSSAHLEGQPPPLPSLTHSSAPASAQKPRANLSPEGPELGTCAWRLTPHWHVCPWAELTSLSLHKHFSLPLSRPGSPPPSSAHAAATFLRLRWAHPMASVASESRPTPETKKHVLALPGEKGTCRPRSHVYVPQTVACSCRTTQFSVPTIPYEAQIMTEGERQT